MRVARTLPLACLLLAAASVDCEAADAAVCTAAVAGTARELLAEARAPTLLERVIGWRRQLHSIPELKYQEQETAAALQHALTDLGVPHGTFAVGGSTGIVATLGTGSPVVALRADMDALPLEEQHADGSPRPAWAPSAGTGRSHACGHDAHMAMLLGAAALLRGRELPPGTIQLVFQPAEEGGAGAAAMLRAGALLPSTRAIFAVHVWPYPGHATGTVASRAGTLMAASVSWSARFHGRGGHAALPHANVDPVVPAAAAILALQQLVSRETSALDSAVISATVLRAGTPTSFNVAPDDAEVGGTLRALRGDTFDRLQLRMLQVVDAIAAAHRCNVTLSFSPDGRPEPYPPLVNDDAAWAFARRVAADMLGDARAVSVLDAPLMTAEDFSFFAKRVPHAAMLLLGAYNASAGAVHALHSPRFTLDEAVLPIGVALHAALAIEFLRAGGELRAG